ncbi:kinase-like protein [Coccomyxa subellipsoidea C-169]|uniref:Kinase-like protein n=1 Tax=Coccomyxa subellipsoidea (strain C-169) TaxID=574566 RepID=I0YL02_COCSC|nr:kinase-like protein [Coccomyxa subellipsoidea C-169]EIE19071.1 kinase-like protein [Coccomyxa subellipsoidea C-169]|eukprot:XP_005643615.1 kinase-like protein [Coccomyxa subellipsoidea C-169]
MGCFCAFPRGGEIDSEREVVTQYRQPTGKEVHGSPVESATSFPEFLSSASFPGKQGRRDESPSTATAVSPLESDLGHFDLDRRAITQMNQLSHSQPPSPKTPKQCVEAEDGTAQVDVQRTGSEAAWQGNPIRGHPRYRKLKEVRGRGAASRAEEDLRVLLCKDEDTGRLVVIKFLRRGTAEVENAEQEVMNLRLCTAHPYIVHLRQVFLTNQYLAIVMEHTPGGNLLDYITNNSPDVPGVGLHEEIARSFFQQLLVAVDFCHAMDIALTDVRPESIMLVEANDAPSLCSIGSHHGEGFVTPVGGLGRRGVPRLKLFSFRLGGGAQPAMAGRADAYTAPEVLQGGPSERQAAGIWSCGVLLHYMLTEELPDLEALKTGAQRGALPLHLKGVSAECRDLLGGMLQVDPAERADAWWIMNHPWFQMDCPEGLVDVDTELLIMLEEGMLDGFCEQSEAELGSVLRRAQQLQSPKSQAERGASGVL